MHHSHSKSKPPALTFQQIPLATNLPTSSLPCRKSRFLGAGWRSFPFPTWRIPALTGTAHSVMDESQQEAVAPLHYFEDSAASVPTVEQIAMGLHLSRTPHLRPIRSTSARPRSDNTPPSKDMVRDRDRTRWHKPRAMPPPPAKSAMKKSHSPSLQSRPSSTTPDSPSLTSMSTFTSASVSTFQSSRRSFSIPAKLRLRMSRILPSQTHAHTDEVSGSPSPQPKLVRFSSDTLDSDGRGETADIH